jgi:hypothetical protein
VDEEAEPVTAKAVSTTALMKAGWSSGAITLNILNGVIEVSDG